MCARALKGWLREMKKTRFNPEDLRRIEAEFEAIKARLYRLSDLMLEANLRHTKEQFYDARVRRVTDSLPRNLHALGDLLWHERAQQPVEDSPPTAVASRSFGVRE